MKTLLNPGLYEQLITQLLRESLTKLDPSLIKTEALDDGDSHDILASYLQQIIGSALKLCKGQDRLSRQIDICNHIIDMLASIAGNDRQFISAAVAKEAQKLLSVADVLTLPPVHPDRPDTPLSRGCILTGTRLDPSLESQIRKEILTSSRIDILCSFIKWSGIRILENELLQFTQRPSSLLRIITTSYMGATDLKAVDFLQSLPNTQLRVSYDTRRTRLHAKAYTFYRNTGFGTAYIGSANISRPALTEGLEWNVKVSQYESRHLWEKITASFETYWNDSEFIHYDDQERPRLQEALQSERGGKSDQTMSVNFDIHPYMFQQEILDQLQAERQVQGRNRHLVVAATGTGKTIIAAFDYKRWSISQHGTRPRMLFVAHRKEILEQSIATFRAVLRDQNFGDLWVGEHNPEDFDHLFVSIQTYNSQRLWEQFPAEHYEYVVVDEFHHSAASSYNCLLNYVQPQILLGLTATPERTDGLDVLHYFGGHISTEIRLPDAVNRKLLCPFQYFGITDSADLSGLTWQRGGYSIDELNRIYTGNDLRADMVIQKVNEVLLNVRETCGLGFCVSVAHAEYMAEKFRRAGIPSEALSANTDTQTRHTVQKRLREREINLIFTVDLYNEGVDLPEVDTVLFLRPTESLTVFLQQFGRGLRHCEGKDCLTVLDFIGQAHKKFRFDLRYRALIDDPSRSVIDQIEQGFPHLPAGCSVNIERIARQHILRNIRQSLLGTTTYLIQEIAELAERNGRVPTLGEFLDFYRLDPDDIYKKGASWSRLCVRAGVVPDFTDPDEDRLTKGLRRIQHISSISQIRSLQSLIESTFPLLDSPDENMLRIILMMHFSLWGRDWKPETATTSVQRLRENPVFCQEMMQLLDYKLSRIDAVAPSLDLPFACPMELHAMYTRDEILAALGLWTLQKQREVREGVIYLKDIGADVFFITLNKTESDYSPTTMYEDYAISDTLFHWQSQSTTLTDSPTGRRYIKHAERDHKILLFVREHKSRNGLSSPYHFLGPVDYISHTGSKPINIVWKLQHPMPAKLLRKTARVAVA